MATIRTDGHEVNGKWVGLPRDFRVKPHVQAFADWAEANYGIDSFGTYGSHQPSPDLAVDCFGTRAEMLALAQAGTRDDVIDRFNVDYVIHDIDPGDHDPGEIWNREIARKWREMADRGGPTQNHYDHVHVSFNPTVPSGTPTPEEDDTMKQYIVHGKGGAWITDLLTFKVGVASAADLEVLRKGGISEIQGDLSNAMLDRIPTQIVPGAA